MADDPDLIIAIEAATVAPSEPPRLVGEPLVPAADIGRVVLRIEAIQTELKELLAELARSRVRPDRRGGEG